MWPGSDGSSGLVVSCREHHVAGGGHTGRGCMGANLTLLEGVGAYLQNLRIPWILAGDFNVSAEDPGLCEL